LNKLLKKDEISKKVAITKNLWHETMLFFIEGPRAER
jgi:hypothetical protein